jgi:hypothetical protein
MIMDDLKKDILAKVVKMPDDWDGFEIKQFIEDYYTMNYLDKSKLKGKRLKEYKNTVLISNLTYEATNSPILWWWPG